jgi:hypothetical protein
MAPPLTLSKEDRRVYIRRTIRVLEYLYRG